MGANSNQCLSKKPLTIPRPPQRKNPAQPSSTRPAQTTDTSTHPTSAEPVAAAAAPRSEKEPSMEDFATALETFEQEQAQTEAALNDEQIVTGTVLKITPQYVVVDIGYKSEGVVPVAEFTDSRGQRVRATGRRNSRDARPGTHRRGLHQPLATTRPSA